MRDASEAGTSPILTIENGRATIRLNRPRYRNRLQPEDLAVLLAHFVEIDRDPSVRVLILTGTGAAFSAGYDLGRVAERAQSTPDGAGSAFEEVADRLENLGLPTICRLNGGVFGGATDLALACDFRIGTQACELVMPAGRLGLHYYPGGIRRYVSRLGVNAAKKLFLTAQRIDAAEMLRIGFLTDMVEADALDDAVGALAATLKGNAPLALRGMKQAINEVARQAFDEAAADARARASMQGDEIREGIAAFGETRAPRF